MLQLDEPRAAALRDLDAALAQIGLEPVLIGGVAVSLVARARNTHDIDAMVVLDTARLADLIAALTMHSFRPLFAGMEQLARDARIAPVVHEPTGIAVDLALGCMPFEEEVVARATSHRAGDLTVRVPTPERCDIGDAPPVRKWTDRRTPRGLGTRLPSFRTTLRPGRPARAR